MKLQAYMKLNEEYDDLKKYKPLLEKNNIIF